MPNTPVTGQIADQKTETPRPFSLGREQILTRLWELAYLSPEMTRGSITGQIKAMSMIVAIEGLIPDRRRSAVPAQPASPTVPVATPAKPPVASANPAPKNSLNPAIAELLRNAHRTSPGNPFVHSEATSSVPAASENFYDALLSSARDFGQPSAKHNDKSRQGR